MKLDFSLKNCYFYIIKRTGFFYLTLILIAAMSPASWSNPVLLIQGESPFYFEGKVMKPAHNEHLFLEELKKNYFRIDNEGRIWKKTKKFTNKYVKSKIIKIPERELNYKNKCGYINIHFNKNDKNYRAFAHRIVWIYLNGEIPDNKEINHINGIKSDNRPENLELVTASFNIKHSYKLGRHCKEGENNHFAKLTNEDVKHIRERYKNGELQRIIAKDFELCSSSISRIVTRKNWSHTP